MNVDEKQIANFLRKKDFRVEQFTKYEKHQSKTPDFRVLKGAELAFFCEVKAISLDEWLDRQLETAPQGNIVGGLRSDPIYNRLSNKIHEAVQQFDAVNPDLEYPNVLALANHDDMCGISDLFAVITGNFSAEGGKIYPVFSRFSDGRIRDEKRRIHLYIWIEDKEKKFYLFNPVSEEIHSKLCGYFDVDPESIRNIY